MAIASVNLTGRGNTTADRAIAGRAVAGRAVAGRAVAGRAVADRAATSHAAIGYAPSRIGPSGASHLLAMARHGLHEAAISSRPAERYSNAHLAALRCAAAVLAARAHPEMPGNRRNRRPRNAWVLLTQVAPELTEWAAFFAVGASKRAAAEAGIDGAVTAREADDLVRDVETFLALVEITVGFAHQPALALGIRAS